MPPRSGCQHVVPDPRRETGPAGPDGRRRRICAEAAAGLAALGALTGLAWTISPHPAPAYTALQAWDIRAAPILDDLAGDIARVDQALASPGSPPPALLEAVEVDVSRARRLPSAPDPRVRDLLRQVLEGTDDGARLAALPGPRGPVPSATVAAAREDLGFAGEGLVLLSRTADGAPSP